MSQSKNNNIKKLPFGEFVALMAFIMSLVALSTDSMLPALANIGQEFSITGGNTAQLTISLFFLGLALGQIIYGPVSDSTGRKPPIYAGFIIFILGSLVSIFATSFNMVLAGRILQGLGAAGPRSVTLSLVRDQYEGRVMARIMSFVMTVFILVPVIAPLLGQSILLFAGWRSIFTMLLVLAGICMTWFAARHPETLHEEYRGEFSVKWIGHAIHEFFASRTAVGYTILAGIIGGCFLGYLNTSRQIFQDMYLVGTMFPLFFAIVALSLGSASFTNAQLVMRFGMHTMAMRAMTMICCVSSLLFLIACFFNGKPPLVLLMIFFLCIFFGIGILFGNLNALAMVPLGKIAGLGAAVVGFISTLLQFIIGTFIGQMYNGTIFPLVGGIALFSFCGIFIMQWVNRREVTEDNIAAE